MRIHDGRAIHEITGNANEKFLVLVRVISWMVC